MKTLTSKHSSRHATFGRAVRETRARRSLSQEELGAIAGLHRNYVGAVERGEINPTLRIVWKLADGLQLPASELLALSEKRHTELTQLVPVSVPAPPKRPAAHTLRRAS